MTTITLIIGVITVIAALYFLLSKKRPNNFPPGPRGLPLFGNTFQIAPDGHKQMMEMSKTYGPILGLRMGSYWAVFLNNSEDIREAMNKPEFAGRWGYNPLLEKNISVNTRGIVLSRGKIWQEERRFCLKTLRDFGLGRRSIEGIIQQEAHDLLQELGKKTDTPMSTECMFNGSVLNVTWAIVAGRRFPYGDERLAELLNFMEEITKNAFTGIKILSFMFPGMVGFREKFVSPFFTDPGKAMQDQFFDYLRKTIDEHRNSMELGNPRDFIDSYLEQVSKSKDDPQSVFRGDDNDMGLITTLMDLFGAGSETTSTSLRWAHFLLALHPQKQEKMYQEIQNVVGNRTVQLEDRPNLPYSEAVISEVFRIGNPTGAGVPHATMEEVTFKGYTIPKNTIVFGNLYASHFSKETFGDPENFRPERFLSADEKTFVKNPHIMPFGVGKRQCVGESVAMFEFFIFLTNMVQKFKITFPPDEPKHSMEPVFGLVLSPQPHRIALVERNT